MEAAGIPILRDQLVERRRQLDTAAATAPRTEEVTRLLQEVDAALHRMDTGTFGLCETCADPIETDRLLADPLTRFCLDHLTAPEQRALEQDLALASRIQRELLPKPDARLDGWQFAYHYQPAGPVSGDYCDLIAGPGGDPYFVIGDVSGKGVAAAMLMSHLNATLRTLISMSMPLAGVVEHASRIFCESTLPTSYATLVCGRALPSGQLEVCNAGHPPALLVGRDGITRLDATGLPIGMFCSERFSSHTVRPGPGDTLLLYTDGLIEAQDPEGRDYGIERLLAAALSAAGSPPATMIEACLRDLASFRARAALRDDLTIMAVRRSGD